MKNIKIRSRTELCDYISSGGKVKILMFWGHRPSKDGLITKSCFSQWFETEFHVDGIRYSSAEQYMMAEKARLFSDETALHRILESTNPGAVKAIGREILGFDENIWLDKRWDIVVQANFGKFSQNSSLQEFLLATNERILVEASPVDKIWGVGLAADDARSENPSEWEGLNLLGFALMEVRSRLARKG
ncbi:MAG: NADAR family protein [Pseudomonadota bacterium]